MNPSFLNMNRTAYHHAALLSYKCYFMPFFIPLCTKSVSNTGQGKASPNHLGKAEGVDVFFSTPYIGRADSAHLGDKLRCNNKAAEATQER